MAQLLAINPSSTLTTTNIPLLNAMIDYAELRIYRELDFLNTQKDSDTSDLTIGTRTITIPGNIFIVNSAYIVTPASTASNAGTRIPLSRVSLEFLNFIWNTTATKGVPTYFALENDTTIVVAPTPDDTYRINCVGVYRPFPLYTSTGGTFITDNLSDLFVAASCVWGFGGINQNFGSAADDPQSAQSWENQYQQIKNGVQIEALRQKAWMNSWQPFSPSPTASQSRT
jgi:hypothetical protein